ncbi:MAG: OmpA family protein, partial [Gammaproteobacteria bacterium]|nr:OmpA family protein [Gammaproteobacteria bacterium]
MPTNKSCYILMICLCLTVWETGAAEPSVAIPENADGIAAVLGKKLTKQKTRGVSRGVDSIVLDGGPLDDPAADAPKVAALIHFDYDSDRIRPKSYPLLREYVKALEGPLAGVVLMIAGHADSDGNDLYNLGLSLRRAEAVRNFLVSGYEIPQNQLLTKAYGESKPVAPNTSPRGKALNRRVEFIR